MNSQHLKLKQSPIRRPMWLAVLTLALLTSACWKEVKQLDQVAWADDDSEYAVVEMVFEEKRPADPLMGTTQKRNFRHRVYLQSTQGNSRTPITPNRPGQNGAEVYYMKSQQYVVVKAVEENLDYRYDIIYTNNGLIEEVARGSMSDAQCTMCGAPPNGHGQMRSCPIMEVLPSPDGTLLAVISSAPTCNADRDFHVEFLASNTLQHVDNTQTVALPNYYHPSWTWTPDGDFVLANGNLAYSLEPNKAPALVGMPNCFYPDTSSSQHSSTGQFVFVSNNQVMNGGLEPNMAFGCQ